MRPVDPHDKDWADNCVSNAMAGASNRLVPSWCDTPSHWTSRVSNIFWTDCPCCLFFRGVIVGAIIGFTLVGITLAVL